MKVISLSEKWIENEGRDINGLWSLVSNSILTLVLVFYTDAGAANQDCGVEWGGGVEKED